MAIEDEDDEYRQHWRCLSQYEYTKVMDMSPGTGRLHHHQSILVWEDNRLRWFDRFVSRLFYATKSLVVKNQFYVEKDNLILATGDYLCVLLRKRNMKTAKVPPPARQVRHLPQAQTPS